MTLQEEKRSVSPAQTSDGSPEESSDSRYQWDINDSNLPAVREHEQYKEWPNGHCKSIYSEESEDARRHTSGWAMRNTNNHNVNILKKSCLGVLVCKLHCKTQNTGVVALRPAICDKARKKQLGKPCPNPRCNGRLELQACKGHCGYPVTHFWRHVNGYIFFQAKGTHDHPQPEVKASAEARRHQYSTKENKNPVHQGRTRNPRKRPADGTDIDYMPSKLPHLDNLDLFSSSGSSVQCSCPPFECVCQAAISLSRLQSQSAMASTVPPASPQVGQVAMQTKREYIDVNDICHAQQQQHHHHQQQQQQWKQHYNDYTDFGYEEKVKSPEYNSGLNPTKMFPNYPNNRMMINCESPKYINGPSYGSDCMYATQDMVVPGSGNSSPNGSIFTPQSSPDLKINMCDSMAPLSQSSSSGYESSPNPYGIELPAESFLDDFKITETQDILFPDQSISKNQNGPYTESQYKSDSCSRVKDNLNIPPLIELPPFTSFLTEEQSKQKMCSQYNNKSYGQGLKNCDLKRHSYQVVPPSVVVETGRLSTASSTSSSPIREPSPVSFTELQPTNESKVGANRIPNMDCMQQTWSSKFAYNYHTGLVSPLLKSPTELCLGKSAFHFYTDNTMTKDILSPMDFFSPNKINMHNTFDFNFEHNDMYSNNQSRNHSINITLNC